MVARPARRQLDALLRVRSAFVLIRDYLAMSPLETDQLLAAQLQQWVIDMDRRYGDIAFWEKGSASPGFPQDNGD